jgi:signal transduction histidine kinase
MEPAAPQTDEATVRRAGLLVGVAERPRGPGARIGGEVASHTVLRRERARRGWRPRGLDLAIALVVFGVTLGTITGVLDTGSYSYNLDALNVALAALTSLPLLAVRRAPLAVFAFTATASVALNVLGPPVGLGPTVALFFLALSPAATRAGRRLTAFTVVGFFVVGAIADWLHSPMSLPAVGAVIWLGVWFAGDWVRLRRERVAEQKERAQQAEREAERERRLAAAEERARIARDLHDSAGHAISVILVQAGAARLLSERDPKRAHQALETIEEVARETLGEIDQLVRALREDGVPEQGLDAVEPPSGLAALDRLIDRHRAAGLDVSVHVGGERRPLTPGVDQAAYRILREALTNAVRHGAGSAAVEVSFGSQALEFTVTNPTRPDWAPTGAGHGILGMRERAALLGGRLTADGGDGRFCVTAELPYSTQRP